MTIITGWLGGQVEAYVNGIANKYTDLEFKIIRENQQLGNIGSLSRIHPADHDILFIFADLVTNIDFVSILVDHRTSGADITLASHLDPP